MKVCELIKLLKTYPQDVEVVTDYCSELDSVEPDWIELVKQEDERIVLRDGRYIRYTKWHWAKEEIPKFQTALHIRGN